jgi:hypothetical protein
VSCSSNGAGAAGQAPLSAVRNLTSIQHAPTIKWRRTTLFDSNPILLYTLFCPKAGDEPLAQDGRAPAF